MITRLPRYTVFTNLTSKESGEFIGISWEFFHDEGDASRCYQRHLANGSVPTIRAFNKHDIAHMGAIHRDELAGIAGHSDY